MSRKLSNSVSSGSFLPDSIVNSIESFSELSASFIDSDLSLLVTR